MASVKALLGGGLAALCEHIKGIRTTVGDLAEATAQSVDEIDGILHEKQDINSKVAFTIPTTGWGTDSSVHGRQTSPTPRATPESSGFAPPASPRPLFRRSITSSTP